VPMEQIAARESKASVFFIGFFVTSSAHNTERGVTGMLSRIELFVKTAEGGVENREQISGDDCWELMSRIRWLVQLRVLRLGFDEDGDAGIGVFPEGEEILIGGFGFGGVAGDRVGTA